MALLEPLPGGVMTNPFGPSSMAIQPSAFWNAAARTAWWQGFSGATILPNVHMGTDFAGVPAGSRLVAIEAGTVTRVGYDGDNGGGWQIEVEIRPGTRYTHNHCQSIANHSSGRRLAPGDKVTRGQTIAFVGATGTILQPNGVRVRSTFGVHDHLVLTIDGPVFGGVVRPIFHDPRMYMAGGARANHAAIQPLTSSGGSTTTDGRGHIAGPNCNIRTSKSLTAANVYANSRTDGWTYRAGTNTRLWQNTSQFLFFGFDGDWAVCRTGGGVNLFIHRSVFTVVRMPGGGSQPSTNPAQRIHINAGVNIRRGAGTQHAIARTTTAAGQYNSPHPYEVTGTSLTQSGITSNKWRTVSLSGLPTCYVWSPLARRV